MAKIAFDIDNTLVKIVNIDDNFAQVPDYELITVLKWFLSNGDEVFAWSGGGVDYAQTWINKLGLSGVKIIPKTSKGSKHPDMDICFDDVECGLAKASILVRNREHGVPER